MMTTMSVPSVRMSFIMLAAAVATYMPPKASAGPAVVVMHNWQTSRAAVILLSTEFLRSLLERQKSAMNTNIRVRTRKASGIIFRNCP